MKGVAGARRLDLRRKREAQRRPESIFIASIWALLLICLFVSFAFLGGLQ